MTVAQAGQAPYGMNADMIPWWRTIAASRTLNAWRDDAGSARAHGRVGVARPETATLPCLIPAYRPAQLLSMIVR